MKNIILLLSLLILVIGQSVCVSQEAFDKQTAERLQKVLQDTVSKSAKKIPGAILRITGSEFGTWTGVAGLSNTKTKKAMSSNVRFRAASILKPFISVVVLQLIEEGKLLLDKPMNTILHDSICSKFKNSKQITIRNLLNHTSGIPDWLTQETSGKLAANPYKIWTVYEYFDIASAQEAYFTPGESLKYSNTNYNLLGLIITKITGNSWRTELRERIIKPLNLTNTRLPEPGDLSMSESHSRGYHKFGPNLIDFTEFDSSMADAAGGHAIITTTSDLNKFINAVLKAELFKNKETLDEMMTFTKVPENAGMPKNMTGYGLGLMKFTLFDNIEMIGHSGGTAGFSSFIYYLPNQKITISGMMNNSEANQNQILLPVFEILKSKFK